MKWYCKSTHDGIQNINQKIAIFRELKCKDNSICGGNSHPHIQANFKLVDSSQNCFTLKKNT